MGRYIQNGIPQVLALVTLTKDHKASLKTSVKDYLASKAGPFYVHQGDEIIISATRSDIPVLYASNRITLPDEVVSHLHLAPDDLLAFIERDGGAALKKVVIEERPGDHAYCVDEETPLTLSRIAYTNPMPEFLVPALQEKYANLKPKIDVRRWLAGRRSLDAWRARQRLGCADANDAVLREELIAERLDAQLGNGSWENDVLVTARHLRELAQLGVTRDFAHIQKAADWVFARARSPWNPGMFFNSDALTAEQIRVVEERKQGNKLRFRQIKKSEQNKVIAGDALIDKLCGPRIMWPNALVTEALLMLGYEDHPRLQEMIGFMREHEWCECGYQNGISDWRPREPLAAEDYEAFVRHCVREYQTGGMHNPGILREACQAQATFNTWYRETEVANPDGPHYLLRMPDHIQGCEFITTRAMRRAEDPWMRQFADAHIWRFAGIQRPDGTFPKESYGSGFGLIASLHFMVGDGLGQVHPAAQAAVWRALPLLLEMQHEDGSWGKKGREDAETYAVVNVLRAVDVIRISKTQGRL